MPNYPQFAYYISPSDKPLSPNDSVWEDPLPVVRPSSGKSLKTIVTHGDYFEATRSFFEQNDLRSLTQALSKRLNADVLSDDVRGIQVHLEKHGEFYHPARIVAETCHQQVAFVLNTAVTSAGEKLIDDEFHNLKRLNDEFHESYLPDVYAIGRTTTAGDKRCRMFLGEWLQNYHEFHVSSKTSGNSKLLCVWDDHRGRYFLSSEQTLRVYRQAAAILTYYYNIKTFEHIAQWHHAAGDFILRKAADIIDLKLITVRRYAPLFQKSAKPAADNANAEQILQALLIFFLKLSFWMRLDRLDGVGDIVWLDPGVVQSALDGVLDGLSQKPANPNLPDAVDICFKYYLTICSPADLRDLSNAILQTFAHESSETHIIQQNLGEHVHHLHQAIKNLRPA